MRYFRDALGALAIAAALVTSAQAQMSHEPPVPMTAAQFAAARTGDSVQISLRVERRKRATVVGEVLNHSSAAVASATGKLVTLYLPGDVPVVMGSAAQIVPGAILFVYGVVTKPGQVDVKRAVVDTKYVKVQ